MNCEPMRIYRSKVALVLAVDTAGALIPVLTMQLFRSDVTWAGFGRDLIYGMIYSHSIGTLAFLIMDRIAPSLFCLPRVYTVAGIVVALVGIAVAGSMIANGLFVVLGA